MILRLAVVALLAFMTLPTLVVIGVSFNPTAILSFPPAGLSTVAVWRRRQTSPSGPRSSAVTRPASSLQARSPVGGCAPALHSHASWKQT